MSTYEIASTVLATMALAVTVIGLFLQYHNKRK